MVRLTSDSGPVGGISTEQERMKVNQKKKKKKKKKKKGKKKKKKK